jgi:hypothetical protein
MYIEEKKENTYELFISILLKMTTGTTLAEMIVQSMMTQSMMKGYNNIIFSLGG